MFSDKLQLPGEHTMRTSKRFFFKKDTKKIT